MALPYVTEAKAERIATEIAKEEVKKVPSCLPPIESGDKGKVLKVNSNASGVEWGTIATSIPSEIKYKNASGTELGNLKFVKCTQAEYNAITPDSNTFYIIVG